MRLVEQHIIEKSDPRLALLDAAAFASKNLWNAANYLVRQSFIFEHVYLDISYIKEQLYENEMKEIVEQDRWTIWSAQKGEQ